MQSVYLVVFNLATCLSLRQVPPPVSPVSTETGPFDLSQIEKENTYSEIPHLHRSVYNDIHVIFISVDPTKFDCE